jgi:putative oxidoreductase
MGMPEGGAMRLIYNLFDVVGRILISAVFLQSGIGKIESYPATSDYMASQGVSPMLLPLVIILEVAGSIAIILGWKTRFFALALAGFCVLAALLFHGSFADRTQLIIFMKDISIAGGFLIIFARGPGRLSVDTNSAKTLNPSVDIDPSLWKRSKS